MKKETLKMIIIKWRNTPRYFLFPTTYQTKEYNIKKNYLGIQNLPVRLWKWGVSTVY